MNIQVYNTSEARTSRILCHGNYVPEGVDGPPIIGRVSNYVQDPIQSSVVGNSHHHGDSFTTPQCAVNSGNTTNRCVCCIILTYVEALVKRALGASTSGLSAVIVWESRDSGDCLVLADGEIDTQA